MAEFKLTFFPGWQQGNDTTEYFVTEMECIRSITDDSKRRPVSFQSVSREKEKLHEIVKRLNGVDWKLTEDDANLCLVDGPDLYFVEGEFGRVTLPLHWAVCTPGFPKEAKDRCKDLLKTFEQLEKLDYEDVPDGP